MLGKLLTMKEQGRKLDWEEVSLECQELKTYWGKWDHIHVRQGILYFLWEGPTGKCDRSADVGLLRIKAKEITNGRPTDQENN